MRDGRQFCVVFQTLRGAVRGQVVGANGLRVVVAVVARVGHEILRALSDLGGREVGFHSVEQRGELPDLVGLRRDLGGEEELRFIDQGLSVAALILALVRGLPSRSLRPDQGVRTTTSESGSYCAPVP